VKGENMNTSKILMMVLTGVFILACNVPALNTPLEGSAGIVATETVQGIEVPPTEIGIQHTIIPVNLPAERSSHAGDFDSSTSAAQKEAPGGDRFTFGRFERPFNAQIMDVYLSQIDIVDTFVFQDETWIYGSITLKDLSTKNTPEARYAIELDVDRDGKGDWLIIAFSPASTEWSVTGVQAFEDTNNDVGDLTAMYADKTTAGDGFESLIFDEGKGNDADTAWVRVSPDNPNVVEIAVKLSVVGSPERYLINMWAGTSLINPAIFDINDHFSHEQAGAADSGFEYFYPIKDVSEIDNSCKMAVGFEPTGQEPGLCEVFIPPVPGEPPAGCQLNNSICSALGPGYYFDESICECNYLG
jgi:hypothetical protein